MGGLDDQVACDRPQRATYQPPPRVPAILGLSTENFIRLRETEYESFKRFQSLTAEAIEETIRDSGSQSPDGVADAVWQKKIRPQVDSPAGARAAAARAHPRWHIAEFGCAPDGRLFITHHGLYGGGPVSRVTYSRAWRAARKAARRHIKGALEMGDDQGER